MPGLISSFISVTNPTGAEPIPDAALFNDTQNLTVAVQPGKTYLFHFINVAAFAAQYLWFEDHTMRIVEVDGVHTEPADAQMVYIAAAQRMSMLITMKNDTSSNFAFIGSMDQVRLPLPIKKFANTHSRIYSTRFQLRSIPMSLAGSCTTSKLTNQHPLFLTILRRLTILRWCRRTASHCMTMLITPLLCIWK